MNVVLCGFDTQHDENFTFSASNGLGYYSLLLIKTPAFVNVNNNKILVKENTAILFHKDTPHSFCAAHSNYSDDFVHCNFDEHNLKTLELLKLPFDTPLPLFDINSLSELVKKICIEHYSKNPYKQKTVELYTEILLTKISEQISLSFENALPLNHDKLSLLRSKIYTLPANDWSIENISKETYMSKSLLHHSYKKAFATTITTDVIKSRTSHAKHLLTQTNLSISRIAKECGYKNDEHFMRQFKLYEKYTPSQYRTLFR